MEYQFVELDPTADIVVVPENDGQHSIGLCVKLKLRFRANFILSSTSDGGQWEITVYDNRYMDLLMAGAGPRCVMVDEDGEETQMPVGGGYKS